MKTGILDIQTANTSSVSLNAMTSSKEMLETEECNPLFLYLILDVVIVHIQSSNVPENTAVVSGFVDAIFPILSVDNMASYIDDRTLYLATSQHTGNILSYHQI